MANNGGEHVLLVNSSKQEPIPLLEADPAIDLTVLTEPGYRGLYAPRTAVLLVADLNDFKAVREAVLHLMSARPLHHIVAPSERSVLVSGYLRSILGMPGVPFEVANRFSNKLVMKNALSAAGLPHLPYAPLRHLSALPGVAGRLGWPVIVKPSFGAGGVDTIVVDSAGAFERLLVSAGYEKYRNYPALLVAESYVDVLAEYHCDGLVVDNKVVFASASRYFDPLFGRDEELAGSYILPEASGAGMEILRLHEEVVAALGLGGGVTHLEVLDTGSGGLVVGEIACRLGGVGVVPAIDMQFGVDLWRAFIDVSLSRRIIVTPHRTPGIVVQVMLPARPGVIRELSGAAELGCLPGVVGVDMKLAVGSRVPASLHSSYVTGLLYARVPDERAVAELHAAVLAAYVCESDPPGPAAPPREGGCW
jgi:biotin carboxylase